ncbi:hypothetical protein N9A22_04310, partial [Methylophilaceae bacterium]|nr:hypothetical protein [Methylophilaceae bacterium]
MRRLLNNLPLLTLLSSLFWSSYLYAGVAGGSVSGTACANGATTLVGCAIGTSDTTYTITGDIDGADGIRGISFTDGADTNILTLNGYISTRSAIGISLESVDFNTINMTGNISSTAEGRFNYGILLAASNSNTTNLTGNITTAVKDADGLSLASSDSNTTNLTGNITTAGETADGLSHEGSDSNTTNLTG